MARATAFDAYSDFRDRVNEAISCVSAGRLSVPSTSNLRAGFDYAAVLNYGMPVTDLRGSPRLTLGVFHRFIIEKSNDNADSDFTVRTTEYAYQIGTSAAQELLAFHWTPQADHRFYRTHPHLHIGSVMIANDSPVPNFPKRHIPTGIVSLQSIIKLLIEEFGVHPRRASWSEILANGE